MDIIVILFITAAVLIVAPYWLSESFNRFIKTRFMGYKAVRITATPPHGGGSRITITKDGKYAQYCSMHPTIKGYTLHPDGSAHYTTLDFVHAKWEYI